MATLDRGSRARIVVAALLAVGLVAGVLVIPVLLSGSKEAAGPAVAADPKCLRAWNSDRITRLLGNHLSVAHLYSRVEVTRLDDSGDPAASDGSCAVIFASPRLDPEPGAAAQILIDGKWQPLSDVPAVDSQRLGALQSEALTRANATLDSTGRLTPISHQPGADLP
jgi:hypothetical protein